MAVYLLLVLATTCSIAGAGTWILDWSDEFEGSALNASNWNAVNATGPSSNQIEVYLASNVAVENGALVLTSRLDNFTLDGVEYNVTSGRIDSSFKRNVTYGRVEVHAKLQADEAVGIHTAHWLLGYDCWPRGGELDIMEYEPEDAAHLRSTSNIHVGDGCGEEHDANKDGSAAYPKAGSGNPVNFTADWHTFAVDWNTTDLVYWVNDTVVRHWSVGWDGHWNVTLPQWPMYIIFSQAYMAKRRADPPAYAWPITQQIDYVRVYRWEEQGLGSNLTKAGNQP